MTLIRLKDGWPVVGDDRWLHLDDDGAILPGMPVIVTLDRWTAERGTLSGHGPGIGVALRSDQKIDGLLGDLDGLDLIALDFPNLNDGRHFSTARLLRERHGFTGQLRATGQVLRDQLPLMARCGFDAFALPDGKDAAAAVTAFREIGVVYQPAADSLVPAAALRARDIVRAAAG